MQQSYDEQEEREKIKFENDIKKIKLSLEHGAHFHESENSQLPPEIEGLWLDRIAQFEHSHNNTQRVLLYDFIGKPDWRPIDEIPSAEIEHELNRIGAILAENNISVDTICEVEIKEIYRFITEELFLHEIDDFRIDGMITHYTYEEFHPNHKYDIERICNDFIETFMKGDPLPEHVYMHVANEVETDNGKVNAETAVQKMEQFRDLFEAFELNEYTVIATNITEDKAELIFKLDFTATIKGNESISLSGEGSFGITKEYDWWNISRINIPGMKI